MRLFCDGHRKRRLTCRAAADLFLDFPSGGWEGKSIRSPGEDPLSVRLLDFCGSSNQGHPTGTKQGGPMADCSRQPYAWHAFCFTSGSWAHPAGSPARFRGETLGRAVEHKHPFVLVEEMRRRAVKLSCWLSTAVLLSFFNWRRRPCVFGRSRRSFQFCVYVQCFCFLLSEPM